MENTILDFSIESTKELESLRFNTAPFPFIRKIFEDYRGRESEVFPKLLQVAKEWQTFYRSQKDQTEPLLRVEKLMGLIFENQIKTAFLTSHQTLRISFKEMTNLLEDFGEEIVYTNFQRLIAAQVISFPFKRFFEAPVHQLFNNLLRHSTRYQHNKFSPQNCSFYGRLFSFQLEGKWTVLDLDDRDYQDKDLIGDYFQEEQRLMASRKDQQESAMQHWLRHGNQLIETVFKSKKPIDDFHLRETSFEKVKECTQFKPTVALSVYRHFRATRILDFSAGWGDRLIAALAHRAQCYLGVDPNINLRKGHLQAIETLYPLAFPERPLLANPLTDFPADYSILYEPFESTHLPPNSKFDLIFTSPPFFDFEIYTSATGQSIQSFPKLDAWMTGFLFVSLKKAWDVLETGGHMVIHITDVYKDKVCEAMNLFIQISLPNSRYCGVLGTLGSSGKVIPMWVWQKSTRTFDLRINQAQTLMDTHFPQYSSNQKLSFKPQICKFGDQCRLSHSIEIQPKKAKIENEINLKNEINSNLKNEINSNSKNEINSNLKNEINSNSKNEINSNLKNEINSNLKNEINSNSKKEENIIKAYVSSVNNGDFFWNCLVEMHEKKEYFWSEIDRLERVNQWDEATVIWKPTIRGLESSLIEKISSSPYGLLNHIPSHAHLTSKGGLHNSLIRAFPKDPIPSYPPTIVWDPTKQSPNQVVSQLKKLSKIPACFGSEWWILKPSGGFGGEQILLADCEQELIHHCESVLQHPKKQEWVVQKYLEQPLLYQKKKFDLRMFLLAVASQDDPSVVLLFLHKGAYCRLSSMPYELEASSNLKIHLTNNSIQKKDRLENELEGLIVNLQEVADQLKLDLFSKIFSSTRSLFRELFAKGAKHHPHQEASFELFGVDFLLDLNGEPWLTELNTNVGMTGPISQAVLKEAIHLVCRIRMRSFDMKDFPHFLVL